MTISFLNIACKIVVNVPFLMAIHGIAFADLNFLDQLYQRGAIQFFKLGVILHHIQPCVHRLLMLPDGGKLLA